MIQIAIDPGVHFCGVAYESGGIFSTFYLPTVQAISLCENRASIVELPRVYRAAKSIGDPEDLIQLARVAGRVEQASQSCRIVRPSEWKGSISKAMHNARILDVAAHYKLERSWERYPASQRHNVIDAVGLFMFGNGFMDKRGCATRGLQPLGS